MKRFTTGSLSLAAILTVAVLMFSSTAVAQDATENSTVNVTVTSEIAIDVHPENLNFPSASVGSQVTTSDRGFTAIEVENIGSEYIDKIWLNATKPSDDPFGTGIPDNYDAANFLQVRPNNQSGLLTGDSDDFHYVNRVEFGSTTDYPSYIDVDGQFNSANPDDVIVGRLRLADEEYFYAIPVGSDGTCDGTSTDFDGGSGIIRIGNTSHTSDRLGTVDFDDTADVQSSIDWTEYSINELSSSDYGITGAGPDTPNGVNLWKDKGTASEVNRTYDLLTICDTSKSAASTPHVVRTRYNPEAGGADDLTTANSQAAQYILNAGVTTSNMLTPGDGVTIDTAVEVPQGVSEGDVSQGTVTVLVTANTTAQN